MCKMSHQGTGDTGEERSNHEVVKLKFLDINTCISCCDGIITNGHVRTADLGLCDSAHSDVTEYQNDQAEVVHASGTGQRVSKKVRTCCSEAKRTVGNCIPILK